MSNQEDYFKDKNNVGTVWKNTNKTNDKQPEFSGLVKVNGDIYRLAIWDNGKNLSLKFQSKDEYQQYTNKSSQPKTIDDLKDDVPF